MTRPIAPTTTPASAAPRTVGPHQGTSFHSRQTIPSIRPTLSALIIARDEARNLPACLDHLAWADEIVVVVDEDSRDATLSIARRQADLVVVRRFRSFADQRNAGLEAASGDWVLAIDADERVTPALAAEIRQALETTPHAGYRLPIRSHVLGRPFRFSGTQLDLPLRLFRRNAGRWTGSVHETVDLAGSEGSLREPLHHQTIPDMTTFLRKIDTYTTLQASDDLRLGRPCGLVDLVVRPAWVFFKLYLARQGFRDGLEGLAFCTLSGVSEAVRRWKHRELLRARATEAEA